MTTPFAEVIGDPIAQSKSPLIHGYWLEQLGIEAQYRACHVVPDALADYVTERRSDPDWRGCNVTIPHKQAVMPLIDRIEPRAQKIGAVNTIWPENGALVGGNTDVEGVGEALAGLDLTGSKVVVLGAGGAARSAFAHLEGMECGSICVLARSPDKAAGVVSDFALPWNVAPLDKAADALAGAALVINATQLGMTGQTSMPPVILEALGGMAGNGHVFDMVYAPLETDLLLAARSSGLGTSDGLVMLVGQARTAFARFFGEVPPGTQDAPLRERLTA